MAGQNVLIKTSDNKPANGWTVKNKMIYSVTKGTTSAQPISLVATGEDGKPLTLNGKLELAVTPQTSKDKKEKIVIGKQRE